MAPSSFDVKTPEESSGFLLWQVTTLWQRDIKSALESFELNHSSFVILASLLWFQEHDVEVTQTTIIEHTKLDKMVVSKSLKQLQQKELLNRVEHKTDTRAKMIILNQSGEKLAKKALKIVEEVDKSFFSKLDESEQKNLNKMFIKLKN